MKRFSNFLLIFCLSFIGLGANKANAQIALDYTDTTLCPGMPLTMCASLTGQGTGITVDDGFSGVLDLGFSFVYFGKTYTKCVVSGNGIVTFDTSNGGNTFGANWTWGQAIGSGQANNTIFVAFFDMHPQLNNGKIRYQRIGSPGNKRFVVEWCDLPTYSAGSPCGLARHTTQVILYEGSNRIEMHTTKLSPITGNCPGASGGYYGQVVQGVRNETGLFSYYPANRDPVVSPTNWGMTGVVNDGMRFTPNGGTTYLMDPIPFNPWFIIDEADSMFLRWYKEGDPNLPIATGPCASAITQAGVDYYVVNYNGVAGCNPTQVNFYDTVRVHFGTSYDTTNVEICAGSTYNWFGKNLFKAGNYDTLLTNQMGCDSFLRLRLFVNPLPNVDLKGSLNVEICDGSSTVLSLLNPESGVSYLWYKDNVPQSAETGTQIIVTQAGRYKVEATTAKGCKLMSAEFKLTVNPNPVANIEPLSDEIICAYDTLELTAVQGTAYDYFWSPEKPFRIVTGAEGRKVKGVFIDPTTDVVLTVYNQFGCYDTAAALVRTKACCEVFIPNAFSPNGDGLNEYFKPELTLGQLIVSMQIFDRYGKMVYNNTNVKKGWDGNYPDGAKAPSGVYMYMMKYTCADGKLYDKKESVSLIR